jgi:hypothetical protein
MSTHKQPNTKRLMNWLLRSLLVVGQQPRGASQGFVLPTVVMVTLVVVLLTTAMILRSFDRSKNASNFRVNEAALNAASPGLDRARAKLDALFDDPALPRGTPSETEMYNAIATKERYTFGDETRLKVAFDVDGNGSVNTAAGPLQNQEVVTTAWRFPVDTDNNGKFDSYTLYGVYLRSPSVGSDGNFNRARNPLEARSAPMVDDRTLDAACKNAFGGPSTSTFLSSTGWYRVNDVLKKSFFVYAATVPLNASDPIVGSNAAKYEAYKGNKGFSALELQQDRSRIPIYNAAVLYEDDLEVAPGPAFNLNGRVFTNSNLLTGKTSGAIQYYQVSSKNSCYIKNEENSKIVVGGNVAFGNFTGDATAGGVQVDLYQGSTIASDNIDSGHRSATDASTQISYNSQVYTERIDLLVRSAIAKAPTQTVGGTYPNKTVSSGDPAEIRNNIASRLNSDASLDAGQVRLEELERYFRQRTRRVPYIEAAFGSSIIGTTANSVAIADANGDGIADANTGIFPATGQLRPPDAWAMPTGSDGVTSTGYTGLTLKGSGTNMEMPMTEPTKRKTTYNRQEKLLGDRIFVGNNLPFLRYLASSDSFIGGREQQLLTGKTWDDGTGTRYRETRIEELPDLGVTNRSGFWEKAATEQPVNALDNVGGLRVITGAGIYHIPGFTSATAALNTPSWFDHSSLGTPNPLRTGKLASGAPAPLVTRDTSLLAGAVGANDRYKVVWPDSMPMMGGVDPTTGNQITDKPDLRMRATAVYHYKNSTGIDQTPIACVSSYYDPTNATTAKNQVNFNGGYGIDTTLGRSNNGVVYPPPYTNPATRLTTAAANIAELKAQATLVFPDGRIVNEQLQNALKKLSASGALVDSTKPLSLAENAAVDTAICAIKIVDGSISPNTTPTSGFTIPHGAIREATFLDARQIKAVDGAPNVSVTATSTTSTRTYSMSNTGSLKKGDVVTITGFNDNTATATDETELNVTRGVISSVTANTSITVLGGTSAGMSSVNSGKIVEAFTGNYDLSIEQRQPLEVRATAIDLAAIKTQVSGASPNEYLFPNSGIIYASRDDALLDLSAPLLSSSEQDKLSQRRTSPVDYRLDSSRRPSAILLENGSSLGREANYRPEEKGLVLATDLPVYIKGDFNLHTQAEFTNNAVAFYNRSGINDNFACRVGQYTGCSTGDPWRPATVLADAITPLSNGYTFGFRNDGDYDTNNNQGAGEAIAKRLKNGFWNNSFVTSRNFTDTDYSTSTGTGANSSYFNNFVTPVQRRGNFPEYVMEICRKLPVSECQPKDWVVGYDANANGTLEPAELTIKASSIPVGTPAGALVSGTTGRPAGNLTVATTSVANPSNTTIPAARLDDQRYPRRIAYKRAANGSLKFTTSWANDRATPIPFGINGSNQFDEFPYDNYNLGTLKQPRIASNALWFRTTTNTAGLPFCEGTDVATGCTADNRTYENDQPLYYLPNFSTASPPTPEIPGIPSLNLPEENPASSYTVCTDQNTNGSSKKIVVSGTGSPESGRCSDEPGNPMAAIDAARDALTNTTTFNPASSLTDNIVTPTRTGPTGAFPAAAGSTTTFTDPYLSSSPPAAGNVINVIDINGDFNTTTACTTINLTGNENSIFVLRSPANAELSFGGSSGDCGVQVVLNGVDPNNVIWAINGNVKWNAVDPSKPHKMTGTFLSDNTGAPKWETVVFDGGRLLGPNVVPSTSNFTPGTTKVIAIGSNGQPLLAPVLQLQVTTLSPTNSIARDTTTNLPTGASSAVKDTKWLPKPSGATTFNLVAAAGDTPARPTEGNGGLHNFLRFLEMWKDVEVKAFGSFVQYKRSVFATAPWQPLFTANTGAGGIFNYSQLYRTDTGGGLLPFYEAPTRNWGFDVALLKQRRPDLLAERFSTEPIFSSNEFFREASRDDEWVQHLLCAKAVSDSSNAINSSERPANCPTGTW